jgi:hypothetical protein
MKFIWVLIILLSISTISLAQDLSHLFDTDHKKSKSNEPVYATFKSTRIVNANSNETIKKHEMDFIISHRFGDAAGKYGGIKTFFGTDNASDIRIAFSYGITDRLTFGLARYKGATAVRQLYETSMKYKLLEQTQDNQMPIGVTLYGNAVVSTMISNVNIKVPDHFDTFADRWSFLGQAIISRKFSSKLSLALIPTYVHYNRVMYGDANDTYAVGVGGRLKLSKRFGIIADYFLVIRKNGIADYFSQNGLPLYNPLGIGIEMETGGHVFQMIFTNSTALLENQYIPYTATSWQKGQFRWGFSFSRTFAFGGKKKHW